LARAARLGVDFGQSFNEEETGQVMLVNTVLALILIYFVMAALFESLVSPAAIWTSILFAIVGVWWFFMTTSTTFSLMARHCRRLDILHRRHAARAADDLCVVDDLRNCAREVVRSAR